MSFRLGEKVVYPNQGVGIVEQISTRNLSGQPETFYLLKLNGNGMRVMVPMTNVDSIGLRRVARSNEIGSILGFLHKGSTRNVPDWKSRFKGNAEKMRTGSLKDVAEVFKNLLTLSQDKPLSFREKRMLDRSWQMLVDEIAVARGMQKDAVQSQLVKTLEKSNLKMPAVS
jgi:CarD family transcriptional regulator